jgi:hypothetical protein
LFVTVDFDKNGYSNGDAVIGKVKVRRADGEKMLAGSSIAYKVSSDDSQDKGLILLDKAGEVNINLKVPEGDLNVLTISVSSYVGFEQQSKKAPTSVTSHSVPLLSKSVSVDFFPEYNDAIIPDVDNRVYIQVKSVPRNPSEEPTFVEYNEIRLKDSAGAVLTTSKHVHNGRGYFTFKPTKTTEYTLEVQRTAKSEWQSFKVPGTTDDISPVMIKLGKTVYNEEDKQIVIEIESNIKEDGNQVNITVQNKFDVLLTKMVTLPGKESTFK